jgi:hypothetical protein
VVVRVATLLLFVGHRDDLIILGRCEIYPSVVRLRSR